MSGLESDYRHRMTITFSKALLVPFSVGAAARPFVDHLPPVLVWQGIANVLLCLTV